MFLNNEKLEKLADSFDSMANDFKNFCENNSLQSTTVDMSNGSDCRSPIRHICETPACHGGWAAIIYEGQKEKERPYFNSSFYLGGARIISDKLNFEKIEDLLSWARNNPDLWGNDRGDCMFYDGSAFGQDSDFFDFPIIYKHYYKVAENIRSKIHGN